MRIDYPTVIEESEAQLLALEQQHRGQRSADRLRLLRLLKSEAVPTLQAAVPMLGYSIAQVTRWWGRYRTGGLTALLAEPAHPGKASQLTPEAWAGLEAAMKAGRIGTREEARTYLQAEWGIRYQSVNGVWWHLHRSGAKPKTGRRRHRRADAVQQEAFKKTLPPRSMG